MAEKRAENNKSIRVAPFITILFFLVIGMIGIMTGEVGRVLAQAVQVCLSCIGIG
jgi:hypothetical protein